MSLAILSNKFELQENTFKTVALAALYSKLDFSSRENSLKENGRIEIWITKRYGNGEDDYDYFSMDIHEKVWSMHSFTHGTFKINGVTYYSLSGTDNAPSRLCYDFSLAYLRLSPNHLISIYEHVFCLDEIEAIEKRGIYTDAWYYNFKKIDIAPLS
jgi:hypothetical protein